MKMYFCGAGRRILAAVLALLLVTASLVGCGQPADDAQSADTTASNLISGEPQIESDPFVYTEEDLTPYVQLGNYRGLSAVRTPAVLTDEELEAEIQRILKSYGEPTKITDRAAAEGDTCNFDFSGYIDGVQFDGGTAAGQSITLTGNGGFIEGFVPAIIGKKPGESFDIVTTFPADYGVDSLNGKEAVFKCTLNYIEGELIIPVFDDAFAQKISDFNTAEELRADLRKEMEAEKVTQSENQLYTDIWTQVLANATILKYPEEKVTYIYQQYVLEYGSYASMAYGTTYEAYIAMMGATDDQVRQMARDHVKEDMIFYALVAAEQITVSDEEFDIGLQGFAEDFGMTSEALLAQYGRDVILDGILWNKTQELLVSWANVTES